MAGWSGLLATTIDDYVRKEVLTTVMRKKIFLKALQDRGRITYDGNGQNHTWPVRYKRTGLTPVADGDTNTFSQIDKRKQAKLPLRGYTATQAINKFNKVQNQGMAALVRLWSDIVKELLDDVRYGFNQKLIQIDGNAAGYTKEIHGLESMFNNTGSDSSNNKTLVANGTYAGISQTLGTYGGSVTGGTWPEGTVSNQYDFWSPLIVDSGGSGFGASTHTFAANSIEILRYVILNTERNGEMVDLLLLAKDYYNSHLLNLDSKETAYITKGSQPGGDTGFGFGPTVHQDNVPIMWETDVLPSTGYGINFDSLELKSWQPQLFMSKLDEDIETNSDRALLDFYGNLICESPRLNSKIK